MGHAKEGCSPEEFGGEKTKSMLQGRGRLPAKRAENCRSREVCLYLGCDRKLRAVLDDRPVRSP